VRKRCVEAVTLSGPQGGARAHPAARAILVELHGRPLRGGLPGHGARELHRREPRERFPERARGRGRLR
jgi:hypothetical protein